MFESSEKIEEIAKALLQAQKNIGGAKKGANNPFFKSKYADLGSVLEACKDHLNDAGISILQPVVSNDQGNFVKTILLHESGQYLASTMQLIFSKNDMQQAGSAISYARRYTLQSLVSIPAEDDDGEAQVKPSRIKQEAKVHMSASGSATDKQLSFIKTLITQLGSEKAEKIIKPYLNGGTFKEWEKDAKAIDASAIIKLMNEAK
ncbi:MAG: ERF family protein [Candidatus Peregrinibacteria bacterium]|nr:ERF family protein [Candidatus Peregrinibacteria bacterium]